MAQQQNNNSGALFKNQKKETDRHPDLQGKCIVDGIEMYVSAWLKESRQGNKYYSLAFKHVNADGGKSGNNNDLPF